jgi:endonuclease/exonuclease/phosphatase (EEP) superfamily protein YafD
MMRQRLPAILAFLALAATVALSVPLVLGFFGRFHPAFDSFAHFRLHLAALMAIGSLALLITRFRLEGAAALLLASAAAAASPGTPLHGLFTGSSAEAIPQDRAVYRLIHFNARFDNRTPEKFLSLLGRERPDVVTMNEVSAWWREKLKPIAATYPHQFFCGAPEAVGGVAILSRRPFAAGAGPFCEPGGKLAIAAVDFGGTPVQIATLHLHWPWPFGQPAQVEDLAAPLAMLGPSAMLAGDFNAAHWSHTVKRIAAAAGMRLAGPAAPTWLTRHVPKALRRFIGLPIDHVLAGGAVTVRRVTRMPDAGSDHLPVLLEFSVAPPRRPPPLTDSVAKLGR